MRSQYVPRAVGNDESPVKRCGRQLRYLAILLGVCFALWSRTALADADPIGQDSWTLAVLPDTQVYAQSFPQHFDAQTEWIADHAQSHNIQFVLHEGDVTNRNTTEQWNNALGSLSILDGKAPYAIAPGNHDYGPGGNAADRNSLFNTPNYYGTGTPYATQPTVGGFFEAGKTDNSFHHFEAGNQDWLVLALEFGPRNEVVDWANQVVADHPDHLVMLVTHAYMYFDETIYDWATKGSGQSWNPHAYGVANRPGETVNDGQELWDKLVSKHDNFRLVFNGHVLGDGTGYRSTLGDHGNVVHQMLANYQFKAQGGLGDMRLLEFKEDGDVVEVRTYSPVLDRHDRSFDQQFTLNLSELHPPLTPPPPPLLKNVVAGNLLVAGPTDPASNTVDGVTVPQATAPPVDLLRINRGDYQIAINGVGMQYQHGVLLATMRQNQREGLSASVEAGRSSFGDGILSLSVMEVGNPEDNELNMNSAVAWFQFAAGWQGAHVDANGTLAAGASNRVEASMVTRQDVGRYHIDLGVDAEQDGLLFAIGGNNDNIVVQTAPNPTGHDQGWDVRVQDNASGFAATGIDRDFAFVYLPYDTPNLIGGLYDGRLEQHLASRGDFALSRVERGEYELTIPGTTPEAGMLLLTVAGESTGGGIIAPDDHVLSYEAAPGGSFLIHSRDLPAGRLQDTAFAWAYVSFANPLSPLVVDGDYNRDGYVNTADYQLWQQEFGNTGTWRSDGNGDGVVNAADYTVWRDAHAAAEQNDAQAVPEPSIHRLLCCLVGMCGAKCAVNRPRATRP